MDGLTYWWKKYQNIKELLRDYMKENKLSTVEETVMMLLKSNKE